MQFEKLENKVEARRLKPGDHIMVGDMLWVVIHTYMSMGNPPRMLQLAYHTHTDPQSYKFHSVRHEEHFEVFRRID